MTLSRKKGKKTTVNVNDNIRVKTMATTTTTTTTSTTATLTASTIMEINLRNKIIKLFTVRTRTRARAKAKVKNVFEATVGRGRAQARSKVNEKYELLFQMQHMNAEPCTDCRRVTRLFRFAHHSVSPALPSVFVFAKAKSTLQRLLLRCMAFHWNQIN